MEIIYTLNNIEQAAESLLKSIHLPAVIAFYGQMGSGKTTLIKNICKLLKVKDVISSPTFSIINQYYTENGEALYHADWYRLKDENEAINAGVEDALYSGNTCFIEWPEKADQLLPEKTIHIKIEVIDETTRKVVI